MSIYKIVRKGEGQRIEFKKSLSEIREIIETLCAFSNTKGGIILVGVDDSGRIIGIDIGRISIEKLVLRIARETNPKIYPDIEVINIDGKKVLKISVEERFDKPVFAFGVAYKRVGRSNVKMDRDEIFRMFRESREISFEDMEICGLEEIDFEKVEKFIVKAMKIRRTKLPLNPKTVLENLGVVRDNTAKISAILLFGKNPQKYIPYAFIKIGKFVSNKIIYEKEVKGDIIEQIEKTYAEILSLIKKEIFIEGLRRKEIYE